MNGGSVRSSSCGSNLSDDATGDTGEAIVAASVAACESLVIFARVYARWRQVMHMHLVLYL
jgi:hypothetical protein